MRSGHAWIKLLHTTFWEFIIVFGLLGVFVVNLVILPKMFNAFGICSKELGFWGFWEFWGYLFVWHLHRCGEFG